LKGNFKTKQVVTAKDKGVESLEDRFEREALKRLGGSIAFVSKKKIMWDAKDAPTVPTARDTGPGKDAATADAAMPAKTVKTANGE
jgi:hypothetical protein